MENIARYIIPASFSQERMQYLAEPSKLFTGQKTEPRKSFSMLWNGWPPCVPSFRTGRSRWSGTKYSATLSEPTVQIIILTPILNEPLCTWVESIGEAGSFV
jgi:hypothetical protein